MHAGSPTAGPCPLEYEEVILRREKQMAPIPADDMSVGKRLRVLAVLQGEAAGTEERQEREKMRSRILGS